MSSRRVLVVVADLFFATRILTTARHLGVAVEQAGAGRAAELCRANPPDLVILDLHGPGAPLTVARELKADPASCHVPLVGYYEHVDQELREAALAAGVDHVLPRSAFTVKLAELLSTGVNPKSS